MRNPLYNLFCEAYTTECVYLLFPVQDTGKKKVCIQLSALNTSIFLPHLLNTLIVQSKYRLVACPWPWS